MKKLFILLLAICFGFVAGCGTNTTSSNGADSNAPSAEQAIDQSTGENTNGEASGEATASNAAGTKSSEDGDDGLRQAVTPEEPGKEEKCSMCNMVVYHKDHPMGRYTGQVVTADGKHLFTDDLGCLLNQIRIFEEEPLGAWVRDYNTLEWIPVDQAIPVRASIETPMKMGFALFSTKEAAEKFLTENPMLSPVITTMDDVDKIALERRKAKLAKKAAEEQAKQAQEKMSGESRHSEMTD